MKVSKRLDGVGEYYFSQKLREIEGLNKQGKNIINLGIGSPDLPPHPSVIEVLQQESAKPNVHAYQNYKGSPILRQAIASWYAKWYHVAIDSESEILPLIGSKEGIMHICMTYLNDGDIALVPNPGYPTYRSAVQLAGGTCVDYNLTDTNQWQPNFTELETVLNNHPKGTVKLLFINYPHMPTGELPKKLILEKLVAFAKQHEILLIHDNPYSFILNDEPFSLLSIDGAMEVSLELNSLSKSQNMAGWRVGMLIGKSERINEVIRFKSNMDSGMFLPVQLAAAKALSLDKDWYDSVNEIYKARRTKVFELLDVLNCNYSKNQVGMFIWATPQNSIDGSQNHPLGLGGALSDKVLYNANVFITPGGIFGTNGLGYIRISLCGSIEKFDEAIKRISEM